MLFRRSCPFGNMICLLLTRKKHLCLFSPVSCWRDKVVSCMGQAFCLRGNNQLSNLDLGVGHLRVCIFLWKTMNGMCYTCYILEAYQCPEISRKDWNHNQCFCCLIGNQLSWSHPGMWSGILEILIHRVFPESKRKRTHICGSLFLLRFELCRKNGFSHPTIDTLTLDLYSVLVAGFVLFSGKVVHPDTDCLKHLLLCEQHFENKTLSQDLYKHVVYDTRFQIVSLLSWLVLELFPENEVLDC